MADKAFVIVKKTGVVKAFDNKYKSSLPKVMKTAAEKAINDSGTMTTTNPNAKEFKTYSLDVSVTSLTQDSGVLEVKVSMAVSENDHMFGFANGASKQEHPNPKKMDDEVERLVTGVMNSLIADRVSDAVQKQAQKNP